MKQRCSYVDELSLPRCSRCLRIDLTPKSSFLQVDANLLCRHVPQMSQSWNLQGQSLQKQHRFQEAAMSYLVGKPEHESAIGLTVWAKRVPCYAALVLSHELRVSHPRSLSDGAQHAGAQNGRRSWWSNRTSRCLHSLLPTLEACAMEGFNDCLQAAIQVGH